MGTGLKSQLEIPGKRHGSSGISPAPAFLVGAGPGMGIALGPNVSALTLTLRLASHSRPVPSVWKILG